MSPSIQVFNTDVAVEFFEKINVERRKEYNRWVIAVNSSWVHKNKLHISYYIWLKESPGCCCTALSKIGATLSPQSSPYSSLNLLQTESTLPTTCSLMITTSSYLLELEIQHANSRAQWLPLIDVVFLLPWEMATITRTIITCLTAHTFPWLTSEHSGITSTWCQLMPTNILKTPTNQLTTSLLETTSRMLFVHFGRHH